MKFRKYARLVDDPDLNIAVNDIADLEEDDVRDEIQGLCFICKHGYDPVPGPRGGVKGIRVRKPGHERWCAYETIRRIRAGRALPDPVGWQR